MGLKKLLARGDRQPLAVEAREEKIKEAQRQQKLFIRNTYWFEPPDFI